MQSTLNRFTFLIVNLKRAIEEAKKLLRKKFTFLIVNLKLNCPRLTLTLLAVFTFLIVNLKRYNIHHYANLKIYLHSL